MQYYKDQWRNWSAEWPVTHIVPCEGLISCQLLHAAKKQSYWFICASESLSFCLYAVVMLKCLSVSFQDNKTGHKMASDSPRRPSRCAGGVLVRAQAAT